MEQDAGKVVAFQAEMTALDPEKIVYVDESGMGDDERPSRGWSAKGALCLGKKPGLPKERLNMIAALFQKTIIAPLVYTVSSTGILVETWFSQCLLPILPLGTTIIMDNAPIHRKKRLEILAATTGCSILWLPPYSPEFNLIEPWWAIIKHKIRHALLHNTDIYAAASSAFKQIP
jgi:transposase